MDTINRAMFLLQNSSIFKMQQIHCILKNMWNYYHCYWGTSFFYFELYQKWIFVGFFWDLLLMKCILWKVAMIARISFENIITKVFKDLWFAFIHSVSSLNQCLSPFLLHWCSIPHRPGFVLVPCNANLNFLWSDFTVEVISYKYNIN